MIHEGTISTGSGCTVLVCGVKRIQLGEAVAHHHLAGVTATSPADIEMRLALGGNARSLASVARLQPVTATLAQRG